MPALKFVDAKNIKKKKKKIDLLSYSCQIELLNSLFFKSLNF